MCQTCGADFLFEMLKHSMVPLTHVCAHEVHTMDPPLARRRIVWQASGQEVELRDPTRTVSFTVCEDAYGHPHATSDDDKAWSPKSLQPHHPTSPEHRGSKAFDHMALTNPLTTSHISLPSELPKVLAAEAATFKYKCVGALPAGSLNTSHANSHC